jgi:hypothetical protein
MDEINVAVKAFPNDGVGEENHHDESVEVEWEGGYSLVFLLILQVLKPRGAPQQQLPLIVKHSHTNIDPNPSCSPCIDWALLKVR